MLDTTTLALMRKIIILPMGNPLRRLNLVHSIKCHTTRTATLFPLNGAIALVFTIMIKQPVMVECDP